jgi:hypothetical protein
MVEPLRVRVITRLRRASLALGFGVSLLDAAMFTVDGGHKAVLFDRFQGVTGPLAALIGGLSMYRIHEFAKTQVAIGFISKRQVKPN